MMKKKKKKKKQEKIKWNHNNKELESHGPEKAGGHFTTWPKTGYTETPMKREAMKESLMKSGANQQPTISVDIYLCVCVCVCVSVCFHFFFVSLGSVIDWLTHQIKPIKTMK